MKLEAAYASFVPDNLPRESKTRQCTLWRLPLVKDHFKSPIRTKSVVFICCKFVCVFKFGAMDMHLLREQYLCLLSFTG